MHLILSGLFFANLLSAQVDQPATPSVTCQPTGQIEHFQISDLGLQCSGETVPDPEGLQTYLDQIRDLLPESLELPRGRGLAFNSNIEVIYEDDKWRLPEPTPLLTRAPDYPGRAAERGLSGRCTLQISVSETGEATQTDIACEQFRRGAPRPSLTFQEEAERAFSSMIWLPMPGESQTCGTSTFDFLLDGHQLPGAEVINAPTCPDTP